MTPLLEVRDLRTSFFLEGGGPEGEAPAAGHAKELPAVS